MACHLVTPEHACVNILTAVRKSNLHFMIQESPYSLYVTLRKTFSKDVTQTQAQNTLPFESENVQAQLDKKDDELAYALDIIKQLEHKRESCETELIKESNKFKASKDKLSDEIKMLKDSIKKSNVEEDSLKKNLSENQKVVKSTEKENHNLQKQIDSLRKSNKNQKEKIPELKKEKTAAERNVKNLENKMKSDQKKFEEKTKKFEIKVPKQGKENSTQTLLTLTTVSEANSISVSTVLATPAASKFEIFPTCPNNNIFQKSFASSHASLTNEPISTINPQINLSIPSNSSIVLESITKSQPKRTSSKSLIEAPLLEKQIFLCPHNPTCVLRQPNPPPEPAPSKPFCPRAKPPSRIRVFPQELLSYNEYRELNVKNVTRECYFTTMWRS